MWNPFRKKKVLDLTKQVKVPESVRARLENEYKDLTQPSSSSAIGSESSLGFLGNLASSSDFSGDMNLGNFKVKIEDIEYKIDSLSRKISSIIDRIDLAEKKIDRAERKGV